MSASPLALAAKKVIDAAWLHGDAYDLSSQAAFALESAQLLQSPETAAELQRLRERVAELETERHSTNESLDDAIQELRRRDDGVYPHGTAQRVQERRAAEEPPRDANCGRPDCAHWGGFHSIDNGCQAHVQAVGEPVEYCPCSEFVAEAGGR